MIMLDDAVRANAKEDDVRVLDLSQLLEESMGSGAVAPCGGRAGPGGVGTVDGGAASQPAEVSDAGRAGRAPMTQPYALASASRSRVARADSILRAIVGTDSRSPLN